MPPIVHHDDGKHFLASHGPVLVSINKVAPQELGVRRVAVAIGELAVKHNQVTIVVVPSANKPALSLEVTQVIAKAWARIAPKLAGGVVWVRREGFLGSIVRSMIAGILLMRPRDNTPVGVVSSLDEVLEAVNRHPAPADVEPWLRGVIDDHG